MKLLFLFFLIILILFLQDFGEASTSFNNPADSLTNVDESGDQVAFYKNYRPRKINCSYACARRCRKASRKKICHRACKTCCARCHCVPPGTYGNKSACPCYARLTTHGNKPKCP